MCLSSLAKTEVYFSLLDNPQKAIIKNINQAQAFINMAMYVFTGSYNWTLSANNRNDENLMVIDDPEIIEIFQHQFVNLWTNKYSPDRTKALFDKAKVDILTVFPPPAPAPPSAQSETKIININSASLEKLTSILQISKPLAQKIIAVREELGGFKNPQDLTQLSEITTLDWQEWEEE
jgi:DNA uptake protein ComE-like DNA-binding protein